MKIQEVLDLLTETIEEKSDGFYVVSKKGKNLGGPYKSHKAALKRLRQVEWFKHH